MDDEGRPTIADMIRFLESKTDPETVKHIEAMIDGASVSDVLKFMLLEQRHIGSAIHAIVRGEADASLLRVASNKDFAN